MTKRLALLIIAVLAFTGCGIAPAPISSSTPFLARAEAFSDLRGGLQYPGNNILTLDAYDPALIHTYLFNERTVFEGNEKLKQDLLEKGKNPGLGVRSLHEQGITGRGVSVAIIDQNMLLEPPEFVDRIAHYYECSYAFEAGQGSMHGPGVASLLVGKSIGVAPEANLYYVAAPSWTRDSAYFAEGLHWIIDLNNTLPKDQKIRVVSVSSAPSGQGSPFTQNQELWEEAVKRAQEAGILVLDCRRGYDTGFIGGGYYDINDPDNLEKVRSGFVDMKELPMVDPNAIIAPCGYRTTVEQYRSADYFFRYSAQAVVSWSIPYVAGVAALGWQINPELSASQLKEFLFKSAYRNERGDLIIHPVAFIEMIKAA